MTLTFDIRPADIAAGARYLVYHHPKLKQDLLRGSLKRTVIYSVIGIISFIVSSGIFNNHRLSYAFFSVPAALVYYFISNYYARRRFIHRFTDNIMNHNPNFVEHLTFAVEETGYHVSSNLRTGSAKWSSVLQIVNDGHYIFLLFTFVEILMIPQHAFNDLAAMHAFATMLQTHKDAVGSSTPQ